MGEKTHGGESSRRTFLNWLLGTSAGGLMLSVFFPVIRYLIPPESLESAASMVRLSIRPEEIRPNTAQIFKFGSRPGILVRTAAGELKAFSASCTHLNCTVQYRDDIGHIWCACHNGHFDLSGNVIQGPPPSPLEEYAVNVQGGQIVVSRTG